MKLAASALRSLEKLWTDGKNVHARLSAKAATKDSSLVKAADDLAAMMKQLGSYNDEFRSFLATAQCFGNGDDLGKWPHEVKEKLRNSEAHVDGNKAMLKRMKGKLV